MSYHLRDNLGRFSVRARASFPTIVAGRLYGYRGTIVRAGQRCTNGKRHISFHKQMHGFVDESELQLINRAAVEDYLSNARRA